MGEELLVVRPEEQADGQWSGETRILQEDFPAGEDRGRYRRMDAVLASALAGIPHHLVRTADGLFRALAENRGKAVPADRILFAVALGRDGINGEYTRLLRLLRLLHPDIDDRKDVVVRIFDGPHLDRVKFLDKEPQLGTSVIARVEARHPLRQVVTELGQVHPAILPGLRVDDGNDLLPHLLHAGDVARRRIRRLDLGGLGKRSVRIRRPG